MSHLTACTHCQRTFTSETSEYLCPSCAPGYARLEAECATRDDAESCLIMAKVRLRGLKRRLDLQPPENLEELVVWLLAHPHVHTTGPRTSREEPTDRDEAFLTYRTGMLWFKGMDGLSYIPVRRSGIRQLEGGDTPISFDPAGFTVYMWGTHIRVEYQL